MNDIHDDDETLERELFAHRRRALEGEGRATPAAAQAGVDDVFARVAVAQRRSRRTRMFGFARVVSQAGTAFAAAAACIALVRGLPANTTDDVRRDDVRVFTRAASGAPASQASTEVASSGASGLACHAEGDVPGDDACEASAVEVSSVAPAASPVTTVQAESLSTSMPAMQAAPSSSSDSMLACESISCGGEVTCAGDGP
jgi:hypothetical protein